MVKELFPAPGEVCEACKFNVGCRQQKSPVVIFESGVFHILSLAGKVQKNDCIYYTCEVGMIAAMRMLKKHQQGTIQSELLSTTVGLRNLVSFETKHKPFDAIRRYVSTDEDQCKLFYQVNEEITPMPDSIQREFESLYTNKIEA